MRVFYKNCGESDVVVFVEPWATEFVVPVGSRLTITPTGEYDNFVQFDASSPGFAVIHIISSEFEAELDGVKLST